jgi:hypothetical protein
MNIEDSKHIDEKDIAEPMKAVFEKQLELAKKYKDIEKLPDWPLNLDIAENQIIIKDFKQRGMEEVAEAIEGFRKGEIMHYKEELIDALHFFVELSILAGKDHTFYSYYKYKKNIDSDITIEKIYYKTGVLCEKFGLLMNVLKCKPWKQSQVLTDTGKFYKLLKEAFEYYLKYLHDCGGMDYIDIYNMYCRKNEVNQFRIRSNY